MDNNLDKLRHSTAHLLAAAVIDLWPKTKHTIGPVIENGFYYDFDLGKLKISEEDLIKIEERMNKIVKSWTGFEKQKVSAKEAKEEFKNNSYKQELISELEKSNDEITLYISGNFLDLKMPKISNILSCCPSQELTGGETKKTKC
jgi:threonyl-tRNA synthetase